LGAAGTGASNREVLEGRARCRGKGKGGRVAGGSSSRAARVGIWLGQSGSD
jgi:hypothetical protein